MNNTQLLVSIVIPTFNREHLIDITIRSVFEQSYVNWECIIVDDGSDDSTIDVLKEKYGHDSRMSIIERTREPKGAPTCRNIGLEKANGDYVMFLDSDDYLLPFCLQRRIDEIKTHQNLDFLVFPMGIQGSEKITKKNIDISDSYLIDFLSFKLGWSIMCPIWKKECLINVGGYSEGYPRLNDPDLMIRVLLNDNVKFKVFYDFDYDSVYVPAKMEKLIYKDKVYQSLLLFIPDMSEILESSHKSDLKKYLANYLHLWFISFYVPLKTSKIRESLNLIGMFYRHNIITFTKSIRLVYKLIGYAITRRFLNRYRWQLIDKTFYNK